jgi:hypothetical protein
MPRNVRSGRIYEVVMSNPDPALFSTKQFLRRAQAAAYVTDRFGFPCSTQWLAKLAVVGGGPFFRKAGRYPIYDPADLDQWAQSRIGPVQRSTSVMGSDADISENGGRP